MNDEADRDLLAAATWQCASCEPGDADPLVATELLDWTPIGVPGTVAAAFRDAGDLAFSRRAYDDNDWWFRCRISTENASGPHLLELEGLATIADVWWNGEHLLHSDNMFVAHQVVVPEPTGHDELLVRCGSLDPVLAVKRPRPRWKSRDLVHQNLRWIRTSLVGRQTGGVPAPAPVGPWRPVRLTPLAERRVVRRDLHVDTDAAASSGRVRLELELVGFNRHATVVAEVAGATAPLEVRTEDGVTVARGVIEVPSVRLWWPHTHGAQPLYDVTVTIDGERRTVGRIGFRTVEVDRTEGGFTIVVNRVPVFCRGVCWTPPDPTTLTIAPDALRQRLELIRRGNLDMVRITGVGVYETPTFFDLCDELGLLVWQDCMFSFCDVPDSPEFRASVVEEIEQLLAGLQGRPSVAVVCGGSENEQQAAFLGLDPDRWVSPIADHVIPKLVAQRLPTAVYVRNTPGESPLPSIVDRGPGHYFGVGAYLRPLDDARRARVRFASECLAFANPPEPLDTPGAAAVLSGIGHRPEWKATIHRDAGASWDLEDVRDWYTRELFDLDPVTLRRVDPDRALEVARMTVATIYDSVLAEWRRPTSPCAGALVLEAHDSSFGGGIGVIDALGRPKSSWYAMRRTMASRAVSFVDEGVNGLGLHVVSDDREPWTGSVTVSLLLRGEAIGDSATCDVKVVAGHALIDTSTLFDGFRDLSWAHRFGPPAYDVVTAVLADSDGAALSRSFHLLGDALRPIERDLGLRAEVYEDDDGWLVGLETERFAQWITFDLVGWYPEDAWFHLAPGDPVAVRLHRLDASGDQPPRGRASAVNTERLTPLELRS